MEKNRLQELAALNAIGALDGGDAEEFRRLVADCAYLRHEISAFNHVAAEQRITASPKASISEGTLTSDSWTTVGGNPSMPVSPKLAVAGAL